MRWQTQNFWIAVHEWGTQLQILLTTLGPMKVHAALVSLAKVSILREAPRSSLCLFAFCTLQKDVVNLKLESNFQVAFFFFKSPIC